MKNKIPPPILLLITGVVMWFVARSEFAAPITIPYALIIALVCASSGLLIAVMAFRRFNSADTTIDPLHPEEASSLVRSGIFSRTRNPMYLGLMLILSAWMIWLASLTNVLVLVAFVVLITELQIKPEEAALRILFGSSYDDYCRDVRRWL